MVISPNSADGSGGCGCTQQGKQLFPQATSFGELLKLIKAEFEKKPAAEEPATAKPTEATHDSARTGFSSRMPSVWTPQSFVDRLHDTVSKSVCASSAVRNPPPPSPPKGSIDVYSKFQGGVASDREGLSTAAGCPCSALV